MVGALLDDRYAPQLARWRKYGELVHADQENLLEADYVEVSNWSLDGIWQGCCRDTQSSWK